MNIILKNPVLYHQVSHFKIMILESFLHLNRYRPIKQRPWVFLLLAGLMIVGCGGGSSLSESSGSRPETPVPETNLVVPNAGAAARFLTQATYGPTWDTIKDLLDINDYADWLNLQFSAEPGFHLPRVKYLTRKMCADKNDDGTLALDTWAAVYPRHQVWWEHAQTAPDQLRQRVAFALSQILVISDSRGLGLSDSQYAVTSFYDVLIKHAFGNYRDLLEEITLHPAMGIFLGMVRNQKADEKAKIRPDENFARELLQLFSIGVHQLNLDGSLKLDPQGNPLPTYDQKTVQEFARVFTGWNFSAIHWREYYGNANRTVPMVAVEKFHDSGEKELLNGEIIPAGNTAREDLEAALDNLFNHPNVAPFISRQLIQRLVKSNPTAEYIARVASVFNNNGKGVRGDLQSVVRSILLDQEALQPGNDPVAGKIREPLLRMSHLWRAFNMRRITRSGEYWEPEKTCGQGNYNVYEFWFSLDNLHEPFGQGPLQAKSVFNFYSPSFSPAGALNNAGIVAPEFQIINENALVNSTNVLQGMTYIFSKDQTGSVASDEYSSLDLSHVTTLAANPDTLLDYLDIVLLQGAMPSSMRTILLDHLGNDALFPDGREGQLAKAREAIALISASPEFMTQR